jgi:hypothetical protein
VIFGVCKGGEGGLSIGDSKILGHFGSKSISFSSSSETFSGLSGLSIMVSSEIGESKIVCNSNPAAPKRESLEFFLFFFSRNFFRTRIYKFSWGWRN